METCYRCEIPLSSANESEEHILLNACGGRLKSKKLLCNTCNSIFGNSFDAELARQTNDLALMLMLERERGEPQPIKGKVRSTGEEYTLASGGKPRATKPTVELLKTDEEARLSITARDEKEFRQILKGLKKKYPNLDIESTSDEAVRETYFMSEPINFTIKVGGEDAFKSVTKSLINYYILRGGRRDYIKHLIPYLEGHPDYQVVWFHHPDKEVYIPTDDEVSHLLMVRGDTSEGILYGYMELFNVHKYVILLNDNYKGPEVKSSYAFDLLKQVELNNEIHFSLTKEELRKLLIDKDITFPPKIVKQYNRLLFIADKIQTSYTFNALLSAAISNGFAKHPGATVLSEDIINDIVKEFRSEAAPFIAHKLNSKRRLS